MYEMPLFLCLELGVGVLWLWRAFLVFGSCHFVIVVLSEIGQDYLRKIWLLTIRSWPAQETYHAHVAVFGLETLCTQGFQVCILNDKKFPSFRHFKHEDLNIDIEPVKILNCTSEDVQHTNTWMCWECLQFPKSGLHWIGIGRLRNSSLYPRLHLGFICSLEQQSLSAQTTFSIV